MDLLSEDLRLNVDKINQLATKVDQNIRVPAADGEPVQGHQKIEH